MVQYCSIKVSKTVFERHKARKEKLGLTWDEYLDEESVSVESNSTKVDYAEIERRVERVLEGMAR